MAPRREPLPTMRTLQMKAVSLTLSGTANTPTKVTLPVGTLGVGINPTTNPAAVAFGETVKTLATASGSGAVAVTGLSTGVVCKAGAWTNFEIVPLNNSSIGPYISVLSPNASTVVAINCW